MDQIRIHRQLELLSVRKNELETCIQKRCIQLDPMNRLPFDILSTIQQLVVEGSYFEYKAICEQTTIPPTKGSPLQVAVDLASVSAFWWSVAISSPRLVYHI